MRKYHEINAWIANVGITEIFHLKNVRKTDLHSSNSTFVKTNIETLP